MTQMQSGKLAKISIKDRLKGLLDSLRSTTWAVAWAGAPREFHRGAGAFVVLIGAIMVVSFAIAKVVVHQGYETIAFATPATAGRLIRQSEVAHFGNRVSNAFGIRGDVATEFADWILEASERQHLRPELIASLVLTESSFRKSVRSHVGAIGPTQVRPDYWGEFCGGPDLHDPEQNVYCGAQVLSHLMDRCDGDQGCALAAYNVGPYSTRAKAANRYVKKIDAYLTSLENRAL